jgi:class 3 adenylate cyclase
VKTTGDGLLATFDGPGRAIGCDVALREQLADIGVQIRAGLHAGEVLVSRTVRDLVAGSERTLADRGPASSRGSRATGGCSRWSTADHQGL